MSMLLKKMEEVIHKMKNGVDAINMSTRMDVVLTVLEAGSKKMMRMDIRLIVSMVDKLVNDDGEQVDKDGRQVDKDGRHVDKDGQPVDTDGRQVDKAGRPALTVVLLASLQHRARPRLLIPVLQT